MQARAGVAGLVLAAPYAWHWRNLTLRRRQPPCGTAPQVSHQPSLISSPVSWPAACSSQPAQKEAWGAEICASSQDPSSRVTGVMTGYQLPGQKEALGAEIYISSQDSSCHVTGVTAEHQLLARRCDAPHMPRPVPVVRPVERQQQSPRQDTASCRVPQPRTAAGRGLETHTGLEAVSAGQDGYQDVWAQHLGTHGVQDQAQGRACNGPAAASLGFGTQHDTQANVDSAQPGGHAEAAVPGGDLPVKQGWQSTVRKARPQVC